MLNRLLISVLMIHAGRQSIYPIYISPQVRCGGYCCSCPAGAVSGAARGKGGSLSARSLVRFCRPLVGFHTGQIGGKWVRVAGKEKK